MIKIFRFWICINSKEKCASEFNAQKNWCKKHFTTVLIAKNSRFSLQFTTQTEKFTFLIDWNYKKQLNNSIFFISNVLWWAKYGNSAPGFAISRSGKIKLFLLTQSFAIWIIWLHFLLWECVENQIWNMISDSCCWSIFHGEEKKEIRINFVFICLTSSWNWKMNLWRDFLWQFDLIYASDWDGNFVLNWNLTISSILIRILGRIKKNLIYLRTLEHNEGRVDGNSEKKFMEIVIFWFLKRFCLV